MKEIQKIGLDKFREELEAIVSKLKPEEDIKLELPEEAPNIAEIIFYLGSIGYPTSAYLTYRKGKQTATLWRV